MTPEQLDRILSSQDTMEPSSGFPLKVMASVRREAAGPAPLRFPWWRFAAGIGACSGVGGAATVLLLQSDVLVSPVPVAVPAIIYGLAMLLVSFGVAAVPRVLSKP